jgi:hypothetical protein
MNHEKSEDLLLHSLDGKVTESEQQQLQQLLAENASLQKAQKDFTQIRSMLGEHEQATFGPFFAERVLNRIRTMQQEVEYQLFSFFKKYQLVALGIIVGLFILNIVLADSLSLKSILGFDDNESDLVQIDLYNDMIQQP